MAHTGHRDKAKSQRDSVPLSPSRRRLFKLLCIAFPLIVFLTLELVLRACGWGGHPPILREFKGTSKNVLVATHREAVRQYFFANPDTSGANTPYYFLMPKPADTVRVFLMGASAIQGWPQPRHLAPSAFLEFMLRDVWPDREIEVINFGTTAIASFPVRDILNQVIEYDPDVVVIYSGHNEFYGAYGTASSSSAWNHPKTQGLQHWVQSLAAVQKLRAALTSRDEKIAQSKEEQLSEAMIGQDRIGSDDWTRNAAARNLKHNVQCMIKICREHEVPSIVCTLPSNERDLVPFGKDDFHSKSFDNLAELNQLIDSASDNNTELEQLEKQLRKQLDTTPQSARAHFFLGKLLAATNRGQDAHDQFVLARDLDTMPWRAPTASQAALREAAQEEGALLCDVEALFRDRSPEEGIGWELMLDHVHPTVQGQALIAEAVIRSMTNLNSPLRITEESLTQLKPWEEYATELGASPYDRYLVVRLMRVFFGTSFAKESNPDAFRRYQQLTERIEREQPQDIRRIIQGWNGKVPLNGIVGGALAGQKQFDEAIPLIRSAQHGRTPYSPAYLEALYNEFTCVVQQAKRFDELQQRRVQQAIERGTLISDCGLPDSWSVDQTIAHLHLLLKQYDAAIPFLLRALPHESGKTRTFDELALIRAYLETGEKEKARTLALEGVLRGGSYSEVYRQLLQSIGN